MSLHNNFFYLKKEMPWKTPTNCEVPYALQDKGAKRSGKKREKVVGAEKAPDESKSDSASKGA
jgi:hypothetical protein